MKDQNVAKLKLKVRGNVSERLELKERSQKEIDKFFFRGFVIISDNKLFIKKPVPRKIISSLQYPTNNKI